ncbi:hypothetical protein N7537_003083 [Penicillium hordei]|uniref:Transcription factor domain-containing protein n=1 Tax=Penicillium hordei TaxID=40994 RepID=A0AAD6H9D1_9EURO|nr:uncharacterized protein N7537_003083 [Penicillium hordei]KAJ5617969.1 hypothetical protein N7537_003083 [Penicillium hordei]
MDGYLPTASSSTSLDGGIANDAELQALEGWPLFQCNPVTPSSACVPTVANHVKNLSALLGDGNMIIHEHQPIDSDVAIESLLTSTREKLSASLQGLYKEAQELYGLRGRNNGKLDHNGASVLTLPSPPVWEFLFCACLRYCEPYYPFIPTATLKINERMEGRNTILPSILLLLMLSIGAMAAGESEISPKIAHGLVEICRISLRRLIEQDIKLASNHEVSQCALLNIIASAWSGDKWQMDIAHYQKSMFLEMHLKAEHHVHRDAQVARLEGSDNVAHSWEIWKEQERANRTSLNTPIPSLDATWNAQSINHWIEGIPSSSGHIIIPPSLDDWIRWFSDTNDISSATHISPITLRLLLCDLQNQVIYLRANIDKSQGPGQTYRNPQNLSIVLIPVQMQSVQELLRKWYDLAKTHRPSKKICPATASNMILYHLIMLNAVVSFPQIEHLARSSPENDTGSKSPRFHGFKQPHHLENTREIYFHCGQVLRHVQSIPEPTRPPWWAGSVYRIALIAWANGMVCTGVDDVHHEGDIDTQTTLFLDALPPDHASIMAYLNHQGGIPAFSGSNGAMVLLGNSVGVIRYCAHFLNTNIKASVTLGIHRKLLAMAQRWESETPQYLGSGWRPHAFHDDMTI